MTEPNQEFFENDVRIEACIYIAGAFAVGELADDVRDFLEDLPGAAWAEALAGSIPALRVFTEEGVDFDEAVEMNASEISTHDGFFVQAATPYRGCWADGSGIYQSGWGHYYTTWLYARTEADIASVALQWAKGRHEHDLLAARKQPA